MQKITLLIIFISSALFSQDISVMVGRPTTGAMNPKSGKTSVLVTYNTIHQFTNSGILPKHANISASFLTSSGFEFRTGKFMKTGGIDIGFTGITYHIKKRKYGIGLHFTSYKHNLSNIYSSKPKETGISIHMRFRKKTVKPFLYFSRTLMYNNAKSLELVTFGATNMYNNILFSMYISAQLEDVFNLDIETAQMNVTLGVLLN